MTSRFNASIPRESG